MKIWEKHYRLENCSDSDLPVSSPLPSPFDDNICGNPIVLDAGETSVIMPITFVTEAMVTKVIVRRSYPDDFGAITDFTVDLFNREVTEANLAELGALARVIPQQTATIDATMELFSGATGAGWSFINLDGNPTVQIRKIYLRIGLVGGAAPSTSTWDLALAGIMTGQGT